MRKPRGKIHSVGDTTNCRQCGAPFEVEEYMVRHSKYVCRPCQVRRAAEWGRTNLEKARAHRRRFDRKRSAQRAARTARYRAENPEKRAAHQAVQTAMRNGSLERQPCEQCGNEKTHAHHADYSKPLAITWLCHTCHMNEHALIAALEK